MKLQSIFLLAMAVPVMAHPGHSGSVHNSEIDLEAARREAPAEQQVQIRETLAYRIIRSNGIPDHETGQFPNRNNPNTISEQDYHFLAPMKPKFAEQPTEVHGFLFGVALNGVVFDPATAEFFGSGRSWNYEALDGAMNLGLDDHHAHVQPNGSYHYHGLPTGLFENQSDGKQQMTLVGWAADGFPIYGLYGHEDPEDPRVAWSWWSRATN